MALELQKRIITSIFLIVLLALMFFYTFVMIISVIVITIISWVEFYALISKIFSKNTNNDKISRFFYKATSLVYFFTASKMTNSNLSFMPLYVFDKVSQ